MIDANKCEYEESHHDVMCGHDVHYFTYPKDMNETEFYPEEDYGNVSCMCISLTCYSDGEITLQMSPVVEDEDCLIDVDWRDLYEGVNYTEAAINELLRKVPNYDKI